MLPYRHHPGRNYGDRQLIKFPRPWAMILIPLIMGMALVAVSHIHGVTDPGKGHTVGELFALGQAQAGFVAASLSALVIFVVFIGWATLESSRCTTRRTGRVNFTRGPPHTSS